ncbi:MAG: hypothetical protein VW396_00085, partial [Ilumatobacter sp.]
MSRPAGPGPLIVLGIAAAVPALLLQATASWADGRAQGDPVPVGTIADPRPVTVAPTPVMSMRREAPVLSRRANQDVLIEGLGVLAASLPGTS